MHLCKLITDVRKINRLNTFPINFILYSNDVLLYRSLFVIYCNDCRLIIIYKLIKSFTFSLSERPFVSVKLIKILLIVVYNLAVDYSEALQMSLIWLLSPQNVDS